MKKILTLLVAIVMLFSMSAVAFAGNGDGSGGGNGEPLMLAGSTVSNGSTNVPTDVYITLTFSKNVVNFSVKSNNMGCFSMVDSKGNSVPLSVIMGDDQVDPDCKRIVGIQPSGLAEGETYTLIISGNMTSKSGVALGSDIFISFTTAGAAAAETPAPGEEPEESAAPEETEEPEIADVEENNELLMADGALTTTAASSAESADDGGLVIAIAASAAVLVAAYFITKEKHN